MGTASDYGENTEYTRSYNGTGAFLFLIKLICYMSRICGVGTESGDSIQGMFLKMVLGGGGGGKFQIRTKRKFIYFRTQ